MSNQAKRLSECPAERLAQCRGGDLPPAGDGVDFGIDGRSVRVSQEAYSIFLAREQMGKDRVAALQQRLYKKAGKDGQKIAGHASEEMTKNYQKEHAEVIWSEAIPDLDISEIAG